MVSKVIEGKKATFCLSKCNRRRICHVLFIKSYRRQICLIRTSKKNL